MEIPGLVDDLFLQEEEQARTIGALMAVKWPDRLNLSLPEAWLLSLNDAPGGGRSATLRPPTPGNAAESMNHA